jgi:hypothetical protein
MVGPLSMVALPQLCAVSEALLAVAAAAAARPAMMALSATTHVAAALLQAPPGSVACAELGATSCG